MHERTHGVPRLLNQLGDFALVYAFADGRASIDADLVAQVVRDRDSGRRFRHLKPSPPLRSA
jgi:general secretion pathway protein A